MRQVIFLTMLAGAGPAGAQSAGPGADKFVFGAFCAVETIDQQVAENTISGVLNLVNGIPGFYSEGPAVPAQIGVGFGVHLDVAPDFAGQARVRTTHPPMGAEGVTEQSWITTYTSGETSYNGFTFEYPYELVQGNWAITAETLDGRPIYRAEFTVLDPLVLPPPPCGTAPLS